MSEPQVTTIRAILGSQRTRRAALGASGVIAAGVMLGGQGMRAAIAQEGIPAASPATADYPELVVIAADFRFDLPPSIPGGFTRLTLQNDGVLFHHAMFMRINDDAALADLEVALTQPDLAPILAVSQSLGGPEVGPGRRASVIADLEPGPYMVICVIPEPDGTPHYMMGMHAPLLVTDPPAEAPPPAADLTIEMVDFAFAMPDMMIAAGSQTWDVPNVGEQAHELVILRLADGVSVAQLQAMLSPEAAATPAAGAAASPPAAMTGPPPFELIGGVAPMSAGYTNWALLDLEAGEHIAICAVLDPATGLPHFALGMIMPFTVS